MKNRVGSDSPCVNMIKTDENTKVWPIDQEIEEFRRSTVNYHQDVDYMY